MIGLFDTGQGGLTIALAFEKRFPDLSFVYYGDHARAPYGTREAKDVVDLTQAGVEQLFNEGCRLVILACNTATAIALHTLQKEWLPGSAYKTHNVIGIIAPTVEAATHTPWAVTTPQYPQSEKKALVAVFGTPRTVASQVYDIEIKKRCPKMEVVEEACPDLASAIEEARSEAELELLVGKAVRGMFEKTQGRAPDLAILGCTHYPLIEPIFRKYLPERTEIFSQPKTVVESLASYLERHPHYVRKDLPLQRRFITSGDPQRVSQCAARFLGTAPLFHSVGIAPEQEVA
jgi:glutamate racemase